MIKKLFNNPVNPNLTPPAGKTNGTYLHKDIVLDRIIHTLTPPTVWAENAELLLAFSQTLVNYSPISININDYWNKHELYNLLEVSEDNAFEMAVYNNINPFKKYKGPQKAYFINATLHLREAIADVYMKNFYDQAVKARTSYTLRRNLYNSFAQKNIETDDKDALLFTNINAIFSDENAIVYKEFNQKKGKAISFKYANKVVYDAKIEGVLGEDEFFSEYETLGVFDYKVTSTILPDVYNAFVKPLTHPLGFKNSYSKECRSEFTDTVLTKEIWTADEVSVRDKNISSTSPFDPPVMLLPWIKNDYTKFVARDQNGDIIPQYNPSLPVSDGWTIDSSGNHNYDVNNVNKPWIYDKTSIRGIKTPPQPATAVPHEDLVCVIPNDENIFTNNEITDANDPLNPLDTNPPYVLATKDGYGLDTGIADIDEGQGNILRKIETGYGDYEYSGFTFTKYIFENGAYVIIYECLQSDGKIRTLIEYYRYDYFDISYGTNLYSSNTLTPRWLYPEISQTNLTHGRYNGTTPSIETRERLIYGYGPETEVSSTTDTAGLDVGIWFPAPGDVINKDGNSWVPVPGTKNYTLNSRVNLISAVNPIRFSKLDLEMSTAIRKKYSFISPNNSRVNTDTIPFDLDNIDVYKNGIKQVKVGERFADGVTIPGGDWEVNGSKIRFVNGLSENDWVEVITRPSVYNLEEYHIFEDTGDGIDLTVIPNVTLGHLALVNPTLENAIMDYDVYLISGGSTTLLTRNVDYEYIWTDNSLEFNASLNIQDQDRIKLSQKNRDFMSNYYHSLESITISPQSTAERLAIYVDGLRLNKNDYTVDGQNLIIKDYVAGTIIEVQELPTEMGVTSHTVRDTSNMTNAEKYEFNLNNYNLQYPSSNTQAYLNGLKLREGDEYETIYEKNEWLQPGIYNWDQETNIIDTRFRYVPVYTLIGRWVEQRASKLNVYGLQQKFAPMEDEFTIETIEYDRNIIHTQNSNDTRSLIHTVSDVTGTRTTNIDNKYQKD